MQIHELTRKKKTELEEGIADTIGGAVGKTVSGVKNVGSAIASPFKDVAQGYSTARQDQKVSAMADKAFRAWQKYVAQLEKSIAVQPAPAVATPKTPPADATPATKDAGAPATNTAPGATVPPTTAAPGTTATPAPTTAPATPQGTNVDLAKAAADKLAKGQADQTATVQALKARQSGQFAPGSTSATAPAKPNYNAQTGAGATVAYKQPTGVPNPNAPQPTNPKAISPTTPGVTVTTPAGTTTTPAKTVGSVANGQPITVGKQKIKPGQPGYDQLAKATLKELQTPAAAVSPALQAFRNRTDGKYEAYLTAFVQKNLLAGMGFKGLVNQQEITNAIKAIASPANADPAKQRPLWNDLTRAAALAVPAAGALTGRDPSGAKAVGAPGTVAPGEEPKAGEEPKPGEEKAAAPTMTKDQISQWITRNSEDNAALSAFLAAINSAGKA
jgi:hypothetical protein